MKYSYCLSGCFLGIGLLDFSKFWHDARNLYEVVHDTPIFWKNFFVPKIGEMGKKLAKISFFLI